MSKLFVIAGFLVAFAAGLVVGTRYHRMRPIPATQPSRHSGSLASLAVELGLTPAQQEQIKKIWAETAFGSGREREERRQELARQRDAAIADLVRPENKQKYEEALRQYTERSATVDREGRAAFQAAVERTRQILTPQQRPRYEEFLKRNEAMRGHRGDRDRSPGRWMDRHNGSRPASRTAP